MKVVTRYRVVDAPAKYTVRGFDVPTWNGGPSRLVLAIEYDEDTDIRDPWTWRVGQSGEIVNEGRSPSRAAALLEMLQYIPQDTISDNAWFSRSTAPTEGET